MSKITSKHEIVELVTRKAIMDGVEINTQAITEALRGDSKLPAHWFTVCRDALSKQGIDCPEHLFAFGPRKRTAA